MGDQGTSGPTHTAGTRQGEDIKSADGKEAGRSDDSSTGADRPSGTTTARDSTSINPDSADTQTGGPSKPPA